MVNVVYHRKYHRLTVKGHAYSGESGYDLICSACSILTYTLASNVYNMNENGQIRNIIVDLQPGNAVVSCNTNKKFKSIVTMIFDSICAGYELLANDYPENITYEIRG